MRSIWKGSISFGLITIPVAVYPAVRSEELKFRLLRKTDLSPVNYKRVAEADGAEVPWEDIVKGYEYEKGRFVVLKDEDFKRVDLEATQRVDIMDFVKLEEISPIFFDKPYYLEPQKGGEKAYSLLRETLEKAGLVGISKVVIRTRQHLAAVKPQKDSLVLEIMHFANELLDSSGLNIPRQIEVGKRELGMAAMLVEQMTSAWDPSRYTDDYRSQLMGLIQEKIDSGGMEVPETGGKIKRRAMNVIDLEAALKESLAQARSTRGEAKRPVRSRHQPNKKRQPAGKKSARQAQAT